jgi:hypothetical protein
MILPSDWCLDRSGTSCIMEKSPQGVSMAEIGASPSRKEHGPRDVVAQVKMAEATGKIGPPLPVRPVMVAR